jgi:hypothetical protein
MMRDGFISWNKFKINSNNKIDKQYRKHKNIDNNHRIIGRAKKSKCLMLIRQTFKIQEQVK